MAPERLRPPSSGESASVTANVTRARSGKVGVPRFIVCCHKARWSGTSGGRIAESRRRLPNGQPCRGAHAKQRRGAEAARRG
ncbi:MAG: hypothetical protein CBHOC_0040 [uncultured Caballeronia sp.]|nr:MAG: hypothetical protein CBHOC_0040 [uncultured Caballeronia sp.]